MAYIQERNGRYKATLRVAGERKSKTFDNYRDAKAWAAAITAISKPATLAQPATGTLNLSVAEALDRYLQHAVPAMRSRQATSQIIKQLLRDCDWVHLPYSHLTADIIRRWRNERLRLVSPTTVSRHLDVIKSACKWAENELDATTQLETVRRITVKKPPQREIERPNKDTLERIFWAADKAEVKWLRPVIEFALYTAMRRSEITSLLWKNVDLDRKLIRVANTKNGYDRTIPMFPDVISLLEEQKAISGVLLTSATDETVWGITPNQLTKCWQRCKKRADVDMRFHDLRHEAASRFFEQGLTPIEVATLTGHRTMSQVMRYSHADLNVIAKKWGQ